MKPILADEFARWFRGDEAAAHFAGQLWAAAQAWDDVEDEGARPGNALLSWLAFGKETHPFFARHAPILRPAMLRMYLDWRAANALERGGRDDVAKAYVLRAGVYGVFHMMAWCIGGDDWAAEVGPEIWRAYSETPEGLWREFNPDA